MFGSRVRKGPWKRVHLCDVPRVEVAFVSDLGDAVLPLEQLASS